MRNHNFNATHDLKINDDPNAGGTLSNEASATKLGNYHQTPMNDEVINESPGNDSSHSPLKKIKVNPSHDINTSDEFMV